MAGCYEVTLSLPGRFLSYLEAVGSTGDTLKKSACSCPLCGTVSSVFKIAVGGICGSVGDASGMLIESCVGVQ